MGYTAPEILLFIGAIAALLVQTIGAWRNGTRSIDTNQKVNETFVKASVIEGHVNSKETKYVAEIAALQDKLKTYEVMMADKDRVAALLAQSASNRTRTTDNMKENGAIPLEIKGPTEVKIVNDATERVPVDTSKRL